MEHNVLSDEEKWQHCVENTMRKTALGFLAGSVAFIFFTRRSLRLASIAFGAGAGFGMGYTECRLSFEKNIHFQRKVIAELDTPLTQIPVESSTNVESNKSE